MTATRFLSRILSRPAAPSDAVVAGPIRGELLGVEHLAERARTLARSQHPVAPRRRGYRTARLLARLDETRGILEDAHTRLARAAATSVDVTPAGEWLLDNFHVVQEHIREVRDSLPRGYYRELPELTGGALAGYPRVYELAITLISHTEGRVDLGNVDLFVGAFQEVTPLAIGELWAVPAMLRLGLLESVRRMARRTVQRLEEQERADDWAARLLAATSGRPAGLDDSLEEFVSRPPTLSPDFVSRFLQQLRAGGGSVQQLVWLERWIAEEGMSAEDAAARANQRVALTQIMMANSITSLRDIGRMEWEVFVERQSAMEAVLRHDPVHAYPRMTFRTRDWYRHVVERIAKRTGRDEPAVARLAVDLARAAPDGPDARRAHVGFYLVDDGRRELEAVTGYRPPPGERVYRWILRHPSIVFVGGVLVVTALVLAGLLALGGAEARSAWALVVALALIPANDVAVSLVNQLVTGYLPPRLTPKLDLAAGGGVPAELRTAVVVPTLVPGVDAVQEALEHLEVQYLANPDPHLHYAILSDFTDAATETVDGDAAIVEAAVSGVHELNRRYGTDGAGPFSLFHRPRQWNPREGIWMGWERKRGKLAQFNRFLRSGVTEPFSAIEGDGEAIRRARYVITLDADTLLAPEAAPLLIGTLAHPLNHAVYDEAAGRVVRGYGVLQPRVTVSLPSANRTRFALIQSGHPGVDPYTTAVSDVYQDLYGEGSYTGKGIYAVEAFERATRGRFPENALLSHDLIEGNYARAGLATDIVVYDDFPGHYLTWTRRKHRWVRGDWQLLPWLTARVPGPEGPEPNRLSLLSRWKILDNLRRSIVEIGQLALFLGAWTALPGSPIRWTLIALGAMAAPWIWASLLAALRPPLDKSWRAYYAGIGRDLVTSAQQLALAVTFLPHQAWTAADAIVRTLWRLAVSRRRLLEWQTASSTERSAASGAPAVWRAMAPGVALAIFALAAVTGSLILAAESAGTPPWTLAAAALPFLVVWSLAPVVAHGLSSPVERRERRLHPRTQVAARRYALLHWRFFERFTGPASAWLVPDNFQEEPDPVVAMRTSPTNIGLQLLATVSAYDLGFIPAGEMVERLERAFDTLDRLERHQGHFYNWYDLETLRVLEPAYVSTVDSGNLSGHLVALRQACLAIPDGPVFDGRVPRALETAIGLASEDLAGPRTGAGEQSRKLASAVVAELRAARDILRRAEAAVPEALADALVPPLTRAHAQLEAASPSAVGATRADGWIAWIIRMVEAHAAGLGGLARVRGVGRDGLPLVRTGTWRDFAAELPEAAELVSRLERLAERADRMALQMDFRFLYDDARSLFSIGSQAHTRTLDIAYYDLLASEARLASFLAVARSEVPVEHWFRLSRTLTRAAGKMALVSWSGSMFEYLMPSLVMRSFPFTLLDQTSRAAVRRHIAFGLERGVPWGVSESAYNLRDSTHTYQYRAFGVPDLALKRGLGRDLVIAPYASALAALIEPERALANLAALEERGALGPYGFFDALDYTRPAAGHRYSVVRTNMAHHIGMTLVALTNALTGLVWQRRFHADASVRSAELLLHERIPRLLVLQKPQAARAEEALPDPALEHAVVREVEDPGLPRPRVALLGQPPYTLMVSHAGGGYSRFENLAVSRWRADSTRDATGQFCYFRDVESGHRWSAAYQPVRGDPDWYRALLATDRVTFDRRDGDLETRTEIAVVAADAAEVRLVTLTNHGFALRDVEVTSYAEVVLAPPDADRAHPAFANLFVETEWHEWCTALTATRRPRSAGERRLWGVHVIDHGDGRIGPVSWETDRARFLGRGRSPRNPLAVERGGDLSGTTGAVLDPVFALRTRLRLWPGQSASVAFTTLVADTPERAFALADRYHQPYAAQRAFDLAWTSAQVELRELGISPAEAAVFQDLAGYLFYGHPALRPADAELLAARGSQPLLWTVGVSGDWPILLATIDSRAALPSLVRLLAAHRYWRRRGMTVDLVILNTRAPSYLQDLQQEITAAVYAGAEAAVVDRPGGVFARRSDQLSAGALQMLRATARVHLSCDGRPPARMVEELTLADGPAELVPPAAPTP
ncbi:MAG: glucoamylase family protein, partial [Gemmatimonadales bacterium]